MSGRPGCERRGDQMRLQGPRERSRGAAADRAVGTCSQSAPNARMPSRRRVRCRGDSKPLESVTRGLPGRVGRGEREAEGRLVHSLVLVTTVGLGLADGKVMVGVAVQQSNVWTPRSQRPEVNKAWWRHALWLDLLGSIYCELRADFAASVMQPRVLQVMAKMADVPNP